jgi:hypothetical protein
MNGYISSFTKKDGLQLKPLQLLKNSAMELTALKEVMGCYRWLKAIAG